MWVRRGASDQEHRVQDGGPHRAEAGEEGEEEEVEGFVFKTLRSRLADKEDKLAEFELLDQNNAIAPMKVW